MGKTPQRLRRGAIEPPAESSMEKKKPAIDSDAEIRRISNRLSAMRDQSSGALTGWCLVLYLARFLQATSDSAPSASGERWLFRRHRRLCARTILQRRLSKLR